MATFLAAILAFPTVVFTVMVVFFFLYVAATLLGALELEWLDGMLGIDDAQDTVLEGALSFLGVAGIPFTIFGGVASVFAWVTSIAADKFLPESMLMDIVSLLGAGAVGLALGGLAVRPLRGLFNTLPAPRRKAIVGKICTVRSLRVDGASGTAEVEDGGSGFVAEVRCFRENDLTRGSKAIVYDYDQQQGIYHVGPIDPSIAQVDFDGRAQTDLA
ncbi:MAG TPA: hypothetical protein VEK79_12750 [Thermoanaerobaculia bacterium]|nr:hypothetical protein [Thermoanaerobaculia bacterium]